MKKGEKRVKKNFSGKIFLDYHFSSTKEPICKVQRKYDNVGSVLSGGEGKLQGANPDILRSISNQDPELDAPRLTTFGRIWIQI